jgi:hypothetical protein
MKTWKPVATPWGSNLRRRRWERLKLWTEQARRQMRRGPDRFRGLVLLDSDPLRPLRDVVQPWQQRDFLALDAAWRRITGLDEPSGATPLNRAYIERPRGHSKTTDVAVQVAWALAVARRGVRGIAAAADADQARLLKDALERLARANPALLHDLKFTRDCVENPANGARLEVIPADVAGSWGGLPDFVICDELCHWTKEEFWQSLSSSAAKRDGCLLAVLSNAGFGRDWRWRVRETARTSPGWYFSTLDGPQAPWITPAALDDQRRLLPAPVFERLWLNRWQHAAGEFLTLAQAEACRDPSLAYRHEGRRGVAYVAAIDYAEKHDLTVGCVCHREGRRVIVDRMDVVRPTPAKPTPVQWVDDWICEVARGFPTVRFVVDAYQLLHTIQSLQSHFDIRRFDFGAGRGNHQLAMVLHELVVSRQVAWYPGCGSLRDADSTSTAPRDDLELELASLTVRELSHGRFRFDHRPGRHSHDDRAFTLAVACLQCLEGDPSADFLEVSLPPAEGGFWLP